MKDQRTGGLKDLPINCVCRLEQHAQVLVEMNLKILIKKTFLNWSFNPKLMKRPQRKYDEISSNKNHNNIGEAN